MPVEERGARAQRNDPFPRCVRSRRRAGVPLPTRHLRANEAWQASAEIEALALEPAAWMSLLRTYFSAAAEAAVTCPRSAAALSVVAAFAFLEQAESRGKFEMLPLYLDLAHSPRAELRRAAVDLLGGFEVATAPGVRDELIRLLRDEEWRDDGDAAVTPAAPPPPPVAATLRRTTPASRASASPRGRRAAARGRTRRCAGRGRLLSPSHTARTYRAR